MPALTVELVFGHAWVPAQKARALDERTVREKELMESAKAKQDELIYRDAPQVKFDLVSTDGHSTGLIVLGYTPEN